MTSIRRSVIIRKETEFGEDPTATSWYKLPPGAYLSFTVNRQASPVYAAGSKFFEAVTYGYETAQWNITFLMDYEYLEMLDLTFEDVTHSSGVHTFQKSNGARVGSFQIMSKQLNHIVGNHKDEVTLLVGAVVKSFSISRSSQTSAMNVSIDGYAMKPKTKIYSNYTSTDYASLTPNLTEYSCMWMGGTADTDRIGEVDQHTLTIDNDLSMIYSTCSAFASQYAEGQASIQWSASAYDNDFEKFKFRSYTGGQNYTLPTTDTFFEPLPRGLAPCETTHFVIYKDKGQGNTEYAKATSGTKYMDISLTDSIVKSMTWQKGDGQKMMQNLNSVQTAEATITIKNDNSTDTVWLSSHIVTPSTPVAQNSQQTSE